MADPIITNGATVLKFRPADLVVHTVPAWAKPQTLHDNSAGLPRVATSGSGRKRILQVALDLERADYAGTDGTYAGYDSLMSFFENDDGTGVDGMAKSFMLTDADGVSYQVRFTNQISLNETIKNNQFTASIELYNEYTLPTDEDTGPELWLTSYDIDNNGGDVATNWVSGDDVGETGDEWTDKSGNGVDGLQAVAGNRPLWKTNHFYSIRPAVDFPTSNDFLTVDGIASAFNGEDQPLSLYCLFWFDTLTADDTIFSISHSSTSNNYIRLRYGYGGSSNLLAVDFYDGSTEKTIDASIPVINTPYLLSMVHTGTTGTIWLDGALDSNEGVDTDVTSISLDQATVGGMRNGGSSITNVLDGRIGELVVFADAHTTLQRRRQELRISDMFTHPLSG